jgi:hypothetical protein
MWLVELVGWGLFDNGSLLDEVPEEQGIAVKPVPEEIEDMKVRSAGGCGLFLL